MRPSPLRTLLATTLIVAGTSACGSGGGSPAKHGVVDTKPVRVSTCPGSSAEPIQAAAGAYVYEAWIGCGRGGIGFARSTDGGRTFGRAKRVPLPRLRGRLSEWDPAVAVAPAGTVYVAYMVGAYRTHAGKLEGRMVPAVAASTDHGRTFSRAVALPIPAVRSGGRGNFGDRDYLAVGPDGTLYMTWDYGPRADLVDIVCHKGGSCAFSHGDLNGVIQKSTDRGRTWTKLAHFTPGFPLGGVYAAPLVAEPDGTLDVLYVEHPTNRRTRAVSPGHDWFTRSTDGGTTWSKPVAIDPAAGTISLGEWWIDGSLAVDPGGTLYAAWDTQGGHRDTAWLAWSSDGGRRWSRPLRVASSGEENLVEVAAAGPHDVYVGWQTLVTGKGYATYLRRFSIRHGWTSPAVRVSTAYGDPRGWPGDTFGLSVEPNGAAVLGWGSATGHGRRPRTEIYAATRALP